MWQLNYAGELVKWAVAAVGLVGLVRWAWVGGIE